jgi:hypothetical protein
MRDTHLPQTASSHDAGTAAFIVWLVVFALFMVALMALGGNSHLLAAHQPATGLGYIGPA